MLDLFLRIGLLAVAGLVTGLIVYNETRQIRDTPHRYHEGGRGSSNYREPHNSWTSGGGPRPSNGSSTKPRRNSPKRRSQKEKLTDDLVADQLDCTICFRRINAMNNVYKCGNCYTIFHLMCIVQKELNSSNWSCPTCGDVKRPNPSSLKYYCMCGKTENPKPAPELGLVPHCCWKECDRCKMPCHPGRCDL